MLTEPLVRGLGGSEAYYLVLERLWAMNVIAVVELDAGVDEVTAAWARMVASLPVLGAQLRVDADGRGELGFGGAGAANGPWDRSFPDVEAAMAAQATEPIDLAAEVVRCALVPRGSVTVAVVAAQHAVLDARGLSAVAMVLAEEVETGAHEAGIWDRPTVSVEAASANPDGRARARRLLALARDVRAEPEYIGNAAPIAWHDPTPGRVRELAFVRLALATEHTDALVAEGRAVGATVQGVLSAVVLGACHDLAPAASPLGLATAVDLRGSGPDTISPIGQGAGLVFGAYDTTGPLAGLAADISRDVRRRVDRGEGGMFFALAGADRLRVGPASDEVVARWTAAAVPSICVSNVGALPMARTRLRGLTLAHAPTPNQSVFVLAATYAGSLRLSIGVDLARVSVPLDMLAERVRSHLLDFGTRRGSGT